MNSQVKILHETLEALSEEGLVRYYFTLNNQTEIGPGGRRVAEELLENFPKEDSENVKAYRSLMFLIDYLEGEDLETGYHVDDYTIKEQLLRLRGKIEEKALHDIVERLEIDSEVLRFADNMEQTQIHDPVTNLSQRASNLRVESKDLKFQHFAQEVLECPIRD